MGQFPDEQNNDGDFERQEDAFRDTLSTDGSTPYAAVAGRYHLYVSLACPWAHRAVIARLLFGLEDAIGLTVVDPLRDERGWAFREGPGHSVDPVNGFAFLRDAYLKSDPKFRGRWTVPVLWDKETDRIVNNSEDDLCRQFAEILAPAATRLPAAERPDWFPADLADEQAALSQKIYETVNNGVYRAGFATSQRAYERAARALFATLDELDARLAHRRFLLADHPVETDWRLFCTLVRFDAVYHGHFKCNVCRIIDYPHLSGYLRDLYQQPGIAETVNFDHIKAHYYATHTDINPTGIVPIGPDLDLALPADRAHLGGAAHL